MRFTTWWLFALLAAGPVAAQDGTLSFDGEFNFIPNRDVILPAETVTDLFAVGAQATDAPLNIRGLSEALPVQAVEDVGTLYSYRNPADRAAAAARLEQLSTDFPQLNPVIGGAADLGLITDGGNVRDTLYAGATRGDGRSQVLLDNSFLFPSRDKLLTGAELEEQYRNGDVVGAAGALAQFYQYGFDGTVDMQKADQYWREAITTSNSNPASLLGYADFLTEAGRSGEAFALVDQAAAQGFPTAVARQVNAAAAAGGTLTDEQLARALGQSGQGFAEPAAALGNFFASTTSGALDLIEAERQYLAAIGGRADQPIVMAQAHSGLGFLYYDHLGAHPTFTRANALEHFSLAADAGEPGGLLGLALLAQDAGQLSKAHALASRAADLGSDEQIARANQLRAQVCAPGTNIKCEPVPVFFATTRKPEGSGDNIRFSNRSEDQVKVSYGIAFVRVPVTSPSGARRLALFGAAKAEAEAQFANAASAMAAGRDITLLSLGMTEDQMAAAAKRVADRPEFGGRAFVYVHGFNNPFEAALRAAAETAEHSGLPAVPVLLSWSSRGDPLKYPADIAAATNGCRHLVAPLKKVGQVFGGGSMTVMAHSMGAQVLYGMLGGCAFDAANRWDLPTRIANVIYAAPDVTRDDFTGNFRVHEPVAEHVTLYASENDAALMLSQSVYNDVARAGTGGDNKRVLLERLVTIDATRVETRFGIGPGDPFNHGYVFSRPEVIADLSLLMNGRTTIDAVDRPCLEPGEGQQAYWWVKKDCTAQP